MADQHLEHDLAYLQIALSVYNLTIGQALSGRPGQASGPWTNESVLLSNYNKPVMQSVNKQDRVPNADLPYMSIICAYLITVARRGLPFAIQTCV
jgi:hypothetical protein